VQAVTFGTGSSTTLEPVEFSCELVDFLDQFGLDDDGHAKFFIDLLRDLSNRIGMAGRRPSVGRPGHRGGCGEGS